MMGHVIRQMDVKTAFLCADMEEDIYVRIPPGVKHTYGYVLKALQSYYGLKQSGRNFYKKLSKFILSQGLDIQPNEDECVFIVHTDKGTLTYLYLLMIL